MTNIEMVPVANAGRLTRDTRRPMASDLPYWAGLADAIHPQCPDLIRDARERPGPIRTIEIYTQSENMS